MLEAVESLREEEREVFELLRIQGQVLRREAATVIASGGAAG